MARIPDFTALGERPVPQQPYMRPFNGPAGGEEIGRGMEEAGQQLRGLGEQQYAQSVNLARAQASNALLDHELTVKGIQQQIGDDVTAGKIPWSQAGQAYQQQVEKLQPPAIPNLDSVGQETLANGIKRITNTGAIAVDGISRLGQRQAFVDQFSAAQDKLGKLAGMPGADIDSINGQLASYRPMALAAGIPANVVDGQIQNFKDRSWFNQAEQRAIAARESPNALKELAGDLSDPKGFYAGKLDADKRTALLRGVTNDQIVLENRLEHEQDKREAKAATAMNQVNEQIASGVPATPAQWNQWGALVNGTSQAGDYQQALKDEQTVQQVLRQPPAQQLAYVQRRAQELDSQGGTLRDRADFIRLQSAVNQNVGLMQKAPLLYGAQRNGTTVQPIDFAAMSTAQGHQQIAQELSDRMATLHAMQKQYGPSVPLRPLLPQEASGISAQLQNSTPQERTQLLFSLHDALGDDAGYQAAMRQIAPHSPVTAIAGQMIGNSAPSQSPTWFQPNFAASATDVQTILQGESLLNPVAAGKQATQGEEAGKGTMKGGMPMPPDFGAAGLRATFGRAAGDMFRDRPQLADAYYSVFKDAYAGLLAQSGNMKGLGDPTLERQALKMALGNTVDFNGNSIAVPRGMDPAAFDGYVKTAVSQAMTSAKAPADWADRIRGYGLREVGGLGSGRYELVNGNSPLVSPDGKGPLIIDMRSTFLPGSAGAKAYSAGAASAQPATNEYLLGVAK
ncbi:MAG TPA: hypothetical protein VFX20_18090 [Steroidobacteraceae bacterium]|nr:hypothetical protein [Steroidobacteraceae bacterium]